MFMAGFDYVLADVACGSSPEQAFDLAATPANKRPQAFMNGAAAARDVLSGAAKREEESTPGRKSYARRLMEAHGDFNVSQEKQARSRR